MANTEKQLSNPFSTGGGGVYFESHVQAAFVVLMLAGGFVPCMPCWPIQKIKLQGKFAGYDTDDLIVFIEKSGGKDKCKILSQIKHSISITQKDKVFAEVIQSAWKDFNKSNLFDKGKDVIALITGPLSATDISDVRMILEWARHAENASEFIREVKETNFSSANKQKKLEAFRVNLKKANGGKPVSDDILFEFMKHFHLLGYDLDLKAGVTLSLLHSLIGQYSQENVQSLWSLIVGEVQSFNKNAGTIVPEKLSDEIRDAFKERQRVLEIIPDEFSVSYLPVERIDWIEHSSISQFTIANLVGGWDENNSADNEVIARLSNEDFNSWILNIRDLLQQPGTPLSLKNGKWKVTDRETVWRIIGGRLFDKNLEDFKQCAISVLSERDPRFDLPSEERYAASIKGKVLNHSAEIRKGIAETLALVGNNVKDLTNCSENKPANIAILTIREIFQNADWVLWGSLNTLLPTLAEAAPDEFLNAVETALNQTPCPYDKLFSQEGNGITGENYITGLLWALESLAWDQTLLVQACVILGELASRDPGGIWANRPTNSLTSILLPWLPQTMASIEKRKVAVRTLKRENPEVAWRLLISLLPNEHQATSGTNKPVWRMNIPDNLPKPTNKDYWEQVSFYIELAVSMASEDINKLKEMIPHLTNLPQSSLDILLALLSSDSFSNKPENERLPLWTALTEFIARHKRHSDTKWALKDEVLSEIAAAAAKLAPKDIFNLHKRLFCGRDFDLYEEKGNWQVQSQKLELDRQKAIKEILAHGGTNSVLEFAKNVDSPYRAGFALGSIAEASIDASFFPGLLGTEDKKLAEFARGYTWSRYHSKGWEWTDNVNKDNWSKLEIAQFLQYLPFKKQTWDRVAELLGESEDEYWGKINFNSFEADSGIEYAVDKLIEHKRPAAALDCLRKTLYDKQPLDKERSVKALLAMTTTTEPLNTIDGYEIVEVIKALQEDPNTNKDDLFRVEWAYVRLLSRDRDASPKLLESRLASDPQFFWEVISLVYRSKKEKESNKELTEVEKAVATNAWRLLYDWEMPPGMQTDGSFSGEQFMGWFEEVKKLCAESGHLEVALIHVGQVLFYCPPDPQGLWIDKSAADVLNAKDAEDMRRGFRTESFNSRGVHWVDPTGKPERELAEQYKKKADDIENAGYQRFAVILRNLSESYERDAERIVSERKESDDD